MDELSFNALRLRMGDDYVGQRLRAQVDRMITGHGRGGLHFENVPLFVKVADGLLRLSGLKARGQRNALQFAVRETQVPFPGLPQSFDGLRILHLSDLHLDGYAGLGGRLAQVVAGLRFDVCVLTGDFRFADAGRYQHIAEVALVPALQVSARGLWRAGQS